MMPGMNDALMVAGQQAPAQQAPPQSPVLEAGAAMLQAFQQDPSEDNRAALTAIMVKSQELLQAVQGQGQPAQGGAPPPQPAPMQ